MMKLKGNIYIKNTKGTRVIISDTPQHETHIPLRGKSKIEKEKNKKRQYDIMQRGRGRVAVGLWARLTTSWSAVRFPPTSGINLEWATFHSPPFVWSVKNGEGRGVCPTLYKLFVYLSTYLSTYQSVNPSSIHHLIYPNIDSLINPSIYPPTYLPTCLFVYLRIYLR